MHYLFYIIGLGCSVCYGVATVLEQVATKKQQDISSLHPSHIYNLFKRRHYIVGILFDVFGWVLFLLISSKLPLFLSFAFVSFSLVVTAFIGFMFLGTKISKIEMLGMLGLMIGLVVLGIIAEPSQANHINNSFKLILGVFPIFLGLISLLTFKFNNGHYLVIIQSIIAGLAFGACGMIARIIGPFSVSLHMLIQPLILSLVAYGFLGTLFLASALQKGNLNKVNSVLFSSEFLIPSILGVIFIHDRVLYGLWPVMIISFIGITIATYAISLPVNNLEK